MAGHSKRIVAVINIKAVEDFPDIQIIDIRTEDISTARLWKNF